MQNNNKTRALSLLDPKTGELTDGHLVVNFPKRYLPKHFSIFTKDIKEFRRLSVYTYEVFIQIAASMSKGNRVAMSEREIASSVQMSQPTVHKAIKQLKNRDILRGERGNYIVNPKYALNGGSAHYVSAHTEYYDTPRNP